MSRTKHKKQKLPDSVPFDFAKLEPIIQAAAKNYQGNLDLLERALGALIMGQLFGYKVLRIIHSPATYAKYERILGVKFREVCPPQTAWSQRNSGYRWAENFGDFWEAIRKNLIPSEGKQETTASE